MSYFDNAKAVTFAGKAVSKLELAGRMIWEAVTLKNWVKLSTESDGQTIYNGGLGYKNGYRIRSGGAETTASNTACTGFIKVDPGDVIRLSGWDLMTSGSQNAINVSGSDFANLGQITAQGSNYGIFTQSEYSAYRWASIVEESTGVWRWIVPPADSGVAYIRVSGYKASSSNPGADMIITINEEIK